MKLSILSSLLLLSQASAWSPRIPEKTLKLPSTTLDKQPAVSSFDPLDLGEKSIFSIPSKDSSDLKALLLSSAALGTPTAASAATAFAPNAIPSALAAYGHYASLLGILACIMIERLTIKPNMSEKEEELVLLADTGFGVWGLLILYTGYVRMAVTEKGLDFYSHEPIFWLKMCFICIFSASSFFNTTTLLKRFLAKRDGEFEPMTEALAKRMIQICNAELVAIGIIPITATFMARGVLYSESIPWQAEAALTAAVFGGLSFKYLKEALTWED